MLEGVLYMFLSQEEIERREELKKRSWRQRAKSAVPWDPKMKWEPSMAIKADTYPVRSLFKVKPLDGADIRKAKKSNLVVSPSEQWAYCEKVLPAATGLKNAYGRRRGEVLFDGPVLIPALHAREPWDKERWDRNPWMSMTPMEFFTLRCGTRFAKGHTIVAGLGLGHQLIECSKRKKVKKLTLVEIEQELVDWLFPHIEPHLEMDVDVIVDNAYHVIPKMEADAALIDIYKGYGGNDFPYCPNVRKVWCWGSQFAERYS